MSNQNQRTEDVAVTEAEIAAAVNRAVPGDTKTPPERWVIDITFAEEAEALRARDAIEKLLFDMGQIGTLCFWSDHDGD